MKVLDYDGLDHSLAKLKAYLDAIRARDLAEADAHTLVLSQGIAVNSARIQSIEDWLRDDERNYVDCITLGGVTYLPQNGGIALPDYPTTLPASDVYAWAKKASLDVNDIPSITTGKISDLETWISSKGFVTRAVNDLTNYYLKSQTYSQAEVNALIGAINQFRYEIAASTSAVASPQPNVLYLIGPIGSGSDKYEEYVYPNSTTGWTKIGETSVDLTGYVNGIDYGQIAETPIGFVSGVSKESGSGTIVFDFTNIYGWALAANKPSYTFAEIGSTPNTLLGYGINDVHFGAHTADSDRIPITLGNETQNVLIEHQSLSGYVNAISPSAETDVYPCPDCDYFYDPAIGDLIGGIAPGTSFADLPSDWVCPICGASKADFVAGGRQFVSAVSKSPGSSTIAFTLNRLALQDLSGANNLKAIEYASGSGLLKKNDDGTWGFDTNSYLTGITSAMVTGALGYTPFNAANFTKSIIKSTLGISDWALAATKPGYAFSELSSKPTTLAGYGITDAASTSDLLSYLPLSGGTMTGQLVTPSIKIPGAATGYAVLESHNGDLLVGDGVDPYFLVLTEGNYINYLYTKADIDNKDNVLTAGIAANSARLQSIEDWLREYDASTYAHQVNLGSTIYAVSNGIVSLPAYPTTLPASDVYQWAKASTKPSYTFSEIGSKPTTLLGYGITDALFGAHTAGSDNIPITLGSTTQNVLIAHQSLTGYVNTVAATAESSVYECSDCDYVYNPANGDPVGGIAPGTEWDDVPSDWVCPVCGASKDDFSEGDQFVYNVIKGTNSSTITFGFRRLRLKNIDGTDDLKAIEALTGTSGLLRKTGSNTWSLDTTRYITKDANNLTNYYTKSEVDEQALALSQGIASNSVRLDSMEGWLSNPRFSSLVADRIDSDEISVGVLTATSLACAALSGVENVNSKIYFSGANVGVANSSPSYGLDVSGTFRATGNAVFGGSIDAPYARALLHSIQSRPAEWDTEVTPVLEIQPFEISEAGNAAFEMVSVRDCLRLRYYNVDAHDFSDSDISFDGDHVSFENPLSAPRYDQSSDQRLKTDLSPIALTVEQIASAPAVEFNWVGNGQRGAGSIAQYWEGQLPYNVHSNGDLLTMEYGNIALISAIVCAREIQNLEARIKELESKLNS